MALQTMESYPLTEAKDRFSALTAKANATGVPFRVLKGGKPWVVVSPVSSESSGASAISIEPVRRTVGVADLDSLFAGYDGSFVPSEDGFVGAAGSEGL